MEGRVWFCCHTIFQKMNLIEIIEAYFHDIEHGLSADKLNKYYAPDAKQIEYPNLMAPEGATHSLSDLQNGTSKGKGVLSRQRVEIQHYLEDGNAVVVEALWTGTLALPIGQIPIGGQMKAHIARFFEFENGKIIRQRNYDCFEPF